MDKDQLMDLAGNPNFISGIYNYCDRWCERCAFTSRCFLYATEQADPDLDDPEVRDITNEKFWRKLQSIFRSTGEMIVEWAAENDVDLNSIDVSEEMAAHEREVEAAEQDELSQAAREYADSVENWFREEFANEETVHDDLTGESSDPPDLTAEDAVEVIRWYQFFIAAKTFRALSGGSRFSEDSQADDDLSFDFLSQLDEDDVDDEDVDYEAVAARAARIDANGSAKIALVAIDRSMSAWRALQISQPEKSESIKPLLIELDRLRRSLEVRFPRARDFFRPGFDEGFSELAS